MRIFFLIFIVAMYVPLSSPHSYLVPGFDLVDIRPMVQRSTLIVYGQILEVEQIQRILERENERGKAGMKAIAQIEIKKTYKGSVTDHMISVHFVIKPILKLYRMNLEKGEHVVLFLVKERDHLYTLASEYFGKIQISTIPSPSPEDSDDVLAQLEHDLVYALESADRDTILDAVRFLGSMRSISSTEKLKHLLPTADRVIEGNVFLSLLKLSDYTFLKEAALYVEEAHPEIESSLVVGGIIREISDIRDQNTLPYLHLFAKSKNVFLRRQIPRALGNINNLNSIPILIASLDDIDQEVRYGSILALAKIVGKTGNWSPSKEEFRENEIEVIDLWTQWFADETGKKQ